MKNTNEHFTSIIALSEIDDISESNARRIFSAYKEKNIIEYGLFDDDKWLLSNERDRRTFDFSIDREAFEPTHTRLNITPEDFKKYLKIFIVNNFGVLALVSLQHIILSIKRSAYIADGDFLSVLSEVDLLWINHIVDFYSVLPAEGREESLDGLLSQCEDAIDQSSFSVHGAQRSLANFESYFRFHDILRIFWDETVDEDEKLFYFPVWLWWNITGVVPTRPHEFILTPRKCLETVDGKHYLILRKNKVKGSNKTKGYRIKDDYKTVKYQIPDALAEEITWYINKTASYMDTQVNTLLVTDTHYHMWDRRAPYTSRYFTYANLQTCLRYFYEYIVHDRYGYHVVMDNTQTALSDEKDIQYIRLGDTRHIALINLIAEGASPITAMVLAGHDNPVMSAHYFSNIEQLIECRVHKQYMKMLRGEQVYTLSVPRSEMCVGESIPCMDKGNCFSQKAKDGDYTDCFKVTGPAGEMGYCQNCDFYRDGNRGFFDSQESYTQRIEVESELLAKIVNQVRNGRGDAEDIACILNRLNSAAYSYERYLLEKEMTQNGKNESD